MFGSTTPNSQATLIDHGLAQTISNQYANVFATNRLNEISSKLVGKHRTSGAVNPKQVLYNSRLEDLININQSWGSNPLVNDPEEAADVMLAGGKTYRKKKSRRYRSKRSKSRGSRKYK